MSASGKTNRLIHETSPYLLQHARNPVAWYPWGEEALQKVRAEDKPLMLSVGYSACHWCHVMERESFESEEIAALLNEHFVSIKVDREERPDIDEIYMNAVQMMTGSGGWPLTVFLTPALKPFYGGTYFPPDDRWGRPGFKTVLTELARVFAEERNKIQETSNALTERLQTLSFTPKTPEILTRRVVSLAARELAARFDAREGGFSPAPKFPPHGGLSLLLRHHRTSKDAKELAMVELTLDKMAAGGMYDHLGGGFHRYSTDERWLVPHFEKMLYDNALLAPVYLDAYRVTGNAAYARVARETLEWVLREMQGDEGGYYSTQDADSEGEEGKFYVWQHAELRALLGKAFDGFAKTYDVAPSGNWEGKTILNLPGGLQSFDESLESSRQKLLKTRGARVHPALDDKILTSWNGLMVVAMARAYRVLGDDRFLDSARRAARFIESNLYEGSRLLATYRSGRAQHKAYLDDHAFFLAGYVELFECDFDPGWLERARQIVDAMRTLFVDENQGGFYFTGSDHESLITRTKTGFDGAIPSGNGIAATYLLKLAEYTGARDIELLAVNSLHTFQAQMEQSPGGFAQMLAAVDFYLSEKREIVVVGPRHAAATEEALLDLWRVYAPNVSIALTDLERPTEIDLPLFKGKAAGPNPDAPRFYVCESYSCRAPTDDVSQVVSTLRT